MAPHNAGTTAPGSSSPDRRHLLSSPPRLPSGKERRQPSITPRKFQRFFTPRSRVSSQPSAARRALRDLTAHALNRSQTPSSPLKPVWEDDNGPGDVSAPPRTAKRRKLHHTPEPSPSKPPPALNIVTPVSLVKAGGKPTLLSPLESLPSIRLSPGLLSESDGEDSEPELPSEPPSPKRVVPLTQRGVAGHLVQRQLGSMPRAGRQFMSCPVADWRVETANFYSDPQDVHLCTSHEGAARCIPFCTATCHTNGIVAVGDEEGRVRLLDSSDGAPEGFNKIHLSFPVHGNAIIDLAFSEDDSLLATASGDQTGKVIDMMTQTPISLLDHHTASLKQVRFQPGKGGGSILATSSRDGSIKIWDLRCKGAVVQDIPAPRPAGYGFSLPRKVTQGCVVNSIYDAHARTLRQTRQQMQASVAAAPSADVATRWEVPGRIGEVSVTAIQFMPAGREHLILSACEADASIKLWDIRNIHTSRQKTSTPVSFTSQPDSHAQWRPFGISSMSLGTDGARLYALCKDNTVYAYSTAHLVLGYAPELATRGDPPKRRNGTAQEGLGPIYGFRHDNLHATSFYVKTAVRPARDGRSELLAVGSSDGCAVLFPTDERYFMGDLHEQPPPAPAMPPHPASALFTSSAALSRSGPRGRTTAATSGGRPGLVRTNSVTSLHARLADTIPMVRRGTRLVRGHEKEVGALSWTHEGRLVTVSDDYAVRCWREDAARAADLRTGGEAEGRRWACGWADVGDGWDDDEW